MRYLQATMMPLRRLGTLLFLLHICRCAADGCGYDWCPKLADDMLHVHLVPHTHDDVGWLKNPDEYFYGFRDDIQRANVQALLDNVVDELLKDERRRFIYVEMFFFKRWYLLQHKQRKRDVATLIRDGRLVFTNGGYTMNDEAATHYQAIIDQMTMGLRFINDTFGPCATPRVAWHIDPFGHSREQANLFAMMGFDSFFFGRLDYDDKDRRLNYSQMEMLWHAGNADLFTGALYNGYNPPDGFCFDAVYCQDDPIQDDPEIEGYNVPQRVDEFLNYAMNQSQHYRTNHILMTMGSDFQYLAATKWFSNMDKLIKAVNALQDSGSRVNVLYSTPLCYTHALNSANVTWTAKSDDFFPYASDPHSYWTGYFSSRPAQKGYIRKMNNLLQASKQIASFTKVSSPEMGFEKLAEALAINQHHDAVTGTEKQAVQNDYIKRLSIGEAATSQFLSKHFCPTGGAEFCPYRNISICPSSESQDQFRVTLYNPLARPVQYYFRVPVHNKFYRVSSSDTDHQLTSNVFPTPIALDNVRRYRGDAPYELTWRADLPATSAASYLVQRSPPEDVDHMYSQFSHPHQSVPPSLQTKFYAVKFSEGTMMTVTDKKSGATIKLNPVFLWYNSSVGADKEPASGAYCFRPLKQTPIPLCDKDSLSVSYVRSKEVTEVRFNCTSWASGVIRFLEEADFIELEWLVGPIPVGDGFAKDIVLQYQTDLASSGKFWTDSNGRQMMERVRNYRPTWKLNSTEPASQNYYPVNSRFAIRDQNRSAQLTVLTDRSQGGTSLEDGVVELMVHRRDLADDGFGVGEALNETGQFGDGLIVRGRHKIILSSVEDAARRHRLLAEEMAMQPIDLFQCADRQNPEALNVSLPENVHLLTLQPVKDLENLGLLLRLEHQFAAGEDPDLSKPVTVDIKEVFSDKFHFGSIREMGLAANVWADQIHRLQWNSDDGLSRDFHYPESSTFNITLQPMEIRTFYLTLV